MTVTKRIRRYAHGLLIASTVTGSAHGFAAGDDPSTAPVPDLSEISQDTRRAIVIEVQVLAGGTTNVLEAVVSDVPPGAVDDDPPLLLLEALDISGSLLQSFNTWDPRFEYQVDEDGREEVVRVEDGEESGIFEVPFDHRIATVRLQDQQTDPMSFLADIDVTALVEDFCVANPGDPNCDGFVPGDQDGDGILNDSDNCPLAANPGQGDLDDDGVGDVCDADVDGDNTDNALDNCPVVSNPDQSDRDQDGAGDPCDPDDDNDGVLDSEDNCPGTVPDSVVDAHGCPVPRDSDGDGVVDVEDACPDTPAGTEVDAVGCALSGGGESCDVDLDGDVDRVDIKKVFWSLGKRGIEPGDPRDADGDGRIGLRDLFICLGSCDRRYCATD